MFSVSVSGRFVNGVGSGFSHGLAVEIEAIGIVNNPVQDGVCEGRFADHVVPRVDGKLACDQDCSGLISVFDDLHTDAGK